MIIQQKINSIASNGGFLPRDLGYNELADLDGKEAKAFLYASGFNVVSNSDNGRYGEAITDCGISLSTNGYCCRK